MTVPSISSEPTIGVFLCRCGQKIEAKVDLAELTRRLKENPSVACVETLGFPCSAPGLDRLRQVVADQNLNRVVIAGCETRVIRQRFEHNLEDMDLQPGQIDIVNLRDHVALAHEASPEKLAAKSAKLIEASIAGLKVLNPSPKVQVQMNGPVMILGGGIATYAAAQELIKQNVESVICLDTDEPEDEIRMLHEHYPGERHYHERLLKMMQEVHESPLVKKIISGQLEKIGGRTGDYTVVFDGDNDGPPRVHKAGVIIAALDGQMLNQGANFGHDGVRVICHTEMEEHIWLYGPPEKRTVFWINDFETNNETWAPLSARSAWNMACYIRTHMVPSSEVAILYNDHMNVPLTAAEWARSRELGIAWVPYDGNIRPTIQSGFITFNRAEDQIEQELAWDRLCLSPWRSPGTESLRVARILGMEVDEERFLERPPQMVRPEMVGQDEKFLAGSSRRPCDLRETLRQGRRAAVRAADLIRKAAQGELYAPRMVCTVDESKCIGCGLCSEICDCGGIGPVESPGNVPRQVDPMVCTGGGTCAAACPYHALTLLNRTTEQREARVASLARALSAGEVLGIACRWGGNAAANQAGLHGITYDPRFFLLPVGCIGQLDPTVMGRAFLEGADNLLLIGCPPEECHHSYGLDHTWSRVSVIKKLLGHCGIERERIALAHADMNNPQQFAVTVANFIKHMDRLGPIVRNTTTVERLQALYDTLRNSRVRWVLGVGLRRPYEKNYPADQRHALAYDETLNDVLAEEFVKVRVVNLLRSAGKVMKLDEVTEALDAGNQAIVGAIKELTNEGQISRVFKDRTPYYVLL